MEDDKEQRPDSLLPYDDWTERALRHVVAKAVEFVVEKGLPDGHHFYLTFRTDHPGVSIPARLKAQYPQEMTIVLQHQFWDLRMDWDTDMISVGLSFGGVPSMLHVPLNAIVAFADPHVRYGLRFRPVIEEEVKVEAPPPPPEEPTADASEPAEPDSPQVVSLDAFRRRSPPRN